MPRNSKRRSGGYWVRSALIFVMHQFIATEGVIWVTILGTFLLRGSISQVSEAWAHSVTRGLHVILTPFFPIQILAGGYAGWSLYRRWAGRSMFSVWILPGVVLTYVVIAIPTFSPWSLTPQTGPLSHYFGWGCQPDDRCYDQLTFTQPFYASVAYSLGALWASHTMRVPSDLRDGPAH